MLFTEVDNLPIYCINLDRRPDRFQRIIKQFDKYDLQIRRWSAVDAKQHNISPQTAVLRSFHSLLDYCKAYSFVLIIEDDIILCNNFLEELKMCLGMTPSNCQALSLHSYKAKSTIINDRICKLESDTFGAHATIFTKQAINNILLSPMNTHIENWLFRPLKYFYGINYEYTLAFQDGIDSDIPETQVLEEYRHFYNTYKRI